MAKSRGWRHTWPRLVGFVVLWGGYLCIGILFARTGALNEDNHLFQSDVARVVGDMTRVDASHWKTNVHPLFVLGTLPVGALLAGALRPVAAGVGLAGQGDLLASILLVSGCGALCALLAEALFRRAGLSAAQSALWAGVLALSASHLLFASIPETFVIAAAAIVAFCLVVQREMKGCDRPSGQIALSVPIVAAGVAALGVVSTNLVTCVLIYGSALSGRFPRRLVAGRLLLFASTVVLLAGVLCLIQREIYPSSGVFVSPRAYGACAPYIADVRHPTALLGRSVRVLEHILLYSIVAPVPTQQPLPGSQLPSLTLPALPQYGVAGVLAALLWMGLLIAAVAASRRAEGANRLLLRGLGLGVLFNLCLHTLYGDDFFLYSGDWTFLVVGFVALSLSQAVASHPRRRQGLAIALVCLLGAQACSNATFLAKALSAFSTGPMAGAGQLHRETPVRVTRGRDAGGSRMPANPRDRH